MTYKKYFCKKEIDTFQKNWVYQFEKCSRKKKSSFYRSKNTNSEYKSYEYYAKDFNKCFVEYKGQPLTMTSNDTDPNILGKSENQTYIRVTITVVSTIISLIVAGFMLCGNYEGILTKIPDNWVSTITSILLLIALMEFWFIRQIREAKQNNIEEIMFGATVCLKFKAFFQSVFTLFGGIHLIYWIALLIKIIFDVIVPVLLTVGIIVAVVSVLGLFFYLNYKLQNKILKE